MSEHLACDSVWRPFLPLNRPLHKLVRNDYGDAPVQDLTSCPSEGVEDGSFEGSSKWVSSVGRDAIVHNALLRLRAKRSPWAEISEIVCQPLPLFGLFARCAWYCDAKHLCCPRYSTHWPGFFSPPPARRICEGRIVSRIGDCSVREDERAVAGLWWT